jgi:hypothetical protein
MATPPAANTVASAALNMKRRIAPPPLPRIISQEAVRGKPDVALIAPSAAVPPARRGQAERTELTTPSLSTVHSIGVPPALSSTW